MQETFGRTGREQLPSLYNLQEFDDSSASIADLTGWNVTGTPREITSDAQLRAAMEAMYAAFPARGFLNGGWLDVAGEPGYGTYAYGQAKNVFGAFQECFIIGDGKLDPIAPGKYSWDLALDRALDLMQHSSQVASIMECGSGRGEKNDATARLYGIASEWLVFEPAHFMRWPRYQRDNPNSASNIFPEDDIVPTEPLQTATNASIATLQAGPNQAFFREFEACYENGRPIGRCASVVFPYANGTPTMPRHERAYSRHAVLRGLDEFARPPYTGTLTWTAGAPHLTNTKGDSPALLLRE